MAAPVVDLLSCLPPSPRKRKKGVLKVDEDKEEGKSDDGTVTRETKEEPSEKVVVVVAEEVKLKKKADDLWASFLSDVGTRPKQAASPAESSSTEKVFGNFWLVDGVDTQET